MTMVTVGPEKIQRQNFFKFTASMNHAYLRLFVAGIRPFRRITREKRKIVFSGRCVKTARYRENRSDALGCAGKKPRRYVGNSFFYCDFFFIGLSTL